MNRDDYILFSGGAPGAEMAVRRERRAPRHRRSQLRLRGPRPRPHPRPAHPEPRGAARRRRQPRLRLAADEPPLHRRADHPQGAAVDLVPGQPRPGDLRHRRRPADDHTVKGGTGWGAEFAKLCNKPLFVFDQERDRWFAWKRRGLGRPAAAGDTGRSGTRTSPAPARGTSPTTARRRSRRCSSAASSACRMAATPAVRSSTPSA